MPWVLKCSWCCFASPPMLPGPCPVRVFAVAKALTTAHVPGSWAQHSVLQLAHPTCAAAHRLHAARRDSCFPSPQRPHRSRRLRHSPLQGALLRCRRLQGRHLLWGHGQATPWLACDRSQVLMADVRQGIHYCELKWVPESQSRHLARLGRQQSGSRALSTHLDRPGPPGSLSLPASLNSSQLTRGSLNLAGVTLFSRCLARLQSLLLPRLRSGAQQGLCKGRD